MYLFVDGELLSVIVRNVYNACESVIIDLFVFLTLLMPVETGLYSISSNLK